MRRGLSPAKEVSAILDSLEEHNALPKTNAAEIFSPEQCQTLPEYFYQYIDVSSALTKRATMDQLGIDDAALNHR